MIKILQKSIAKIFNSRLFFNNPYIFAFTENLNKIVSEENYISKTATTRIEGLNLNVRKPSKDIYLEIGENSCVQGNFVIESEKGFIKIGDRSFIGSSSFICNEEIIIGNDVLLSWGCTLIDSNSHPLSWSDRENDVVDWKRGLDENRIGAYKDWTNVKVEKIFIKNKAWVGFNCIITKGVTIGEGAIVASGSVVTKDVPDWTIVGGNPAKIIREISEDER